MAEEPGHELRAGLAPDLGGGTVADHAALAHHHQAIGHRVGLLLVVGDVDRGRARRRQHPSQVHGEAIAQGAVERAERLVEHEQPRGGGERAGQRHPLGLAAREGVDGSVLEAGQAHQVEHLGHPGSPGPRGVAAHPGAERHVLPDRPVREQRVVLEHQTEAPLVGGTTGEVAAVPGHPTGHRRLEPGQHAQQGALAAAARAHHRDHLARCHGQRHVVERHRVAEAHGEVLRLQPRGTASVTIPARPAAGVVR